MIHPRVPKTLWGSDAFEDFVGLRGEFMSSVPIMSRTAPLYPFSLRALLKCPCEKNVSSKERVESSRDETHGRKGRLKVGRKASVSAYFTAGMLPRENA